MAATCANLISEALLLAGDTSLSARGVVWLNQWLRSQYAAWPWPFLIRRASSLTLAAGTTSLTVGGGSGGVTPAIRRLVDPVYLYTTARTTQGTVRLTDLLDGDQAFDGDSRPSTQTGLPRTVQTRANATTWGKWDLIFDPIPEQAYLFSFDYYVQPTDEATGTAGGTAVPLYPNDRTIMHAIAAMALAHMGDERASEFRDVAAAMAIDDRGKFGMAPKVNDHWTLDKSTYR